MQFVVKIRHWMQFPRWPLVVITLCLIGSKSSVSGLTNQSEIKVIYMRTKESSREERKIDEAILTLATRRIETESLLPGYKIVINTLSANNCTIGDILEQVVGDMQLFRGGHGIMCGGCDEVCDAVLHLAEGTNSPAIGYLCHTDALRNPVDNKFFMTTAHTRTAIGGAYLGILNHFNWTGGKVAILVMPNKHSYELAKSVRQTIEDGGRNYSVSLIPYSIRKSGGPHGEEEKSHRFCESRFQEFRHRAQCEYSHTILILF